MSHWDFGRPPDNRPDAPGQAGPSDAAYPDDARIAGDPWPTRDDWAPDDPWSAGYAWAPDDSGGAADGGSPADGGWAADEPWPADNGWTRDDSWPQDGWPADGGPAGTGSADEEEGMSTGPYPLTYERDAFTGADAGPARPALDEDYEPWPPAPYPPAPYPGEPYPGEPGKREDTGAPGEPGEDWGYQGDGGRRGGARRWLIPAGVVVAGAAVGAAAVLLTGGRPGGQAGQGAGRPAVTPAASRTARGTAGATATPSGPPLSIAEAQQVLAGYTTVNNEANAQRSDVLLATVEAGSSYAIDAGLYQMQRAAGSPAFPPFSPVQATYYIPRGEPAGGPRWFVVQVGNAFTSDPAKVTSAEYLLFTQSAPGGRWQDAIEPYLLSGASAPQVAVGSDGLATALGPAAATVTVAPGQLPTATAAALDGTGGGQAPAATPGVTTPGNLADRADQRTWQAAVQGGQVSDAHSPAAGAGGQEFALLTTDGGALVFYTDAAEVTITPPAGAQLQLAIPGFYSPGQALAQARVSYLEQFAAYDPPAAAGGAPRVVADYSAITGAG